ncbi:hypothetical protein PMAYCL1PPCAC_27221 [Pristionchus mayeri]|uniref:Invertebrate defensins family profile domain-containing protein n=1 Tax=Pristionchus mayeri TaxID=1317129 RepID=A0AAN5BZ46_9BILA|nr:hypothetical protein PMAYCL1PPCAC_00843 [Pristionchus mayeri]GMR57021.1 hypothetical protein PMAYCL1PPCAC_27216 [Pristionchus mayeri]GMR57026.1 hypothetical protein PMAYCL1PPCAC_27221 [Pristionchus mayeri]
MKLMLICTILLCLLICSQAESDDCTCDWMNEGWPQSAFAEASCTRSCRIKDRTRGYCANIRDRTVCICE